MYLYLYCVCIRREDQPVRAGLTRYHFEPSLDLLIVIDLYCFWNIFACSFVINDGYVRSLARVLHSTLTRLRWTGLDISQTICLVSCVTLLICFKRLIISKTICFVSRDPLFQINEIGNFVKDLLRFWFSLLIISEGRKTICPRSVAVNLLIWEALWIR